MRTIDTICLILLAYMCAVLVAFSVSLIANGMAPKFLLHIRRHSHDTCVNCCNGRNRSSKSESTVWHSRRVSVCTKHLFRDNQNGFPQRIRQIQLHHRWDKLFKNALSFGVYVAEVSSISNPATATDIVANRCTFPFSLVFHLFYLFSSLSNVNY